MAWSCSLCCLVNLLMSAGFVVVFPLSLLMLVICAFTLLFQFYSMLIALIFTKKQLLVMWIFLYFSHLSFIYFCFYLSRDSPAGSVGKESACNAGDTGDMGLIPGPGRSPGEGKGNPLQYSCLGNSLDRRAWWATVHGVTKSQIQLSR